VFAVPKSDGYFYELLLPNKLVVVVDSVVIGGFDANEFENTL
jgi:hypothetical protein